LCRDGHLQIELIDGLLRNGLYRLLAHCLCHRSPVREIVVAPTEIIGAARVDKVNFVGSA
jgi:hypothetical protein